jgi:carbonic anhydrase/acetyltransferase-like protein (isoleucine patch superfamily)
VSHAPFVAPTASVSPEAQLGQDTSVFYCARLEGPVVLEDQVNVQDNAVVEGTSEHPVRIGRRTSLGHNARVFGATIDQACLIAIAATVLPGAHVGSHSIIAANATVPEGMHVPPNSLVIGHGRILRPVREDEIARIEHGANEYVRLGREHLATLSGAERSSGLEV